MSGWLRSAGLLPYRLRPRLEVLIAHPGGPYFARRDDGWWSIIKGLIDPDEDEVAAAARELTEETGWEPPPLPWIPLGETRLKSGKVVTGFAAEADYDPAALQPGTFLVGGRSYPEVDRVAWFDPETAAVRLNPAQVVFVERLLAHLSGSGNNGD